MSGRNNLEKALHKGLIIPLYFGMAGCTFTEAMTAKKGLETCTNAALKTKNTSGSKLKVKEFNLWIGLGIRQWCFKTACSSLEGGMGMIPWTIFISTVSCQIIGMKSIEQTGHLLNQGIATQQSFVGATYMSLAELIPISNGLTTYTSSSLTKGNGRKSIALGNLLNLERFIEPLFSAISCTLSEVLTGKDWIICTMLLCRWLIIFLPLTDAANPQDPSLQPPASSPPQAIPNLQKCKVQLIRKLTRLKKIKCIRRLKGCSSRLGSLLKFSKLKRKTIKMCAKFA